ncbi:MAG: clan AA aspartic protease [Chloroflexota bacterium]|nr:clan AA aspartic protease [Chloroflexota bacterium]
MGTFRVRIEIGDPQGERFEAVEALVDTGASHTALPASVLRELGIEPYERGAFRLADGRLVELDIGQTWVQVNGKRAITQVVFADEATEPLLGAVTLEQLGLGIDPVTKQLIPVPRLLM